jgi:predicted lysophospholipase L1 biosynthesis ABC-type transport system permease subunit
MRQLTENIEQLVAKKTQPFFGGDIRISFNGYMSGSIQERIAPYLSWVTYSFGEKTEFSTTLFDQEGKTGLLKVVAYSGTYPQKGILKLEKLSSNNEWEYYLAATSEVINRFASWGTLVLDERKLKLTDTVLDSSDLW